LRGGARGSISTRGAGYSARFVAGFTFGSGMRRLPSMPGGSSGSSTEREWLKAARGKSVREVERLVSGHRPGNRPDDWRDPEAKRHVLRLEVSGETLAVFRDALALMRRDAGEPIDEDAAVLLLVRTALAGPREEGRASYQVALTVCENCLRGKQLGKGECFAVAPEIIQMAACDSQLIGSLDGGATAHVGASAADSTKTEARSARRPKRASQAVPPSVRRLVHHRDHGRCAVPGCRHAVFVDVHHLSPRQEAGDHDPENLVTLCAAHHRANHNGTLLISGTPATGLRFSHADGTSYGTWPCPRSSDLNARVYRALVRMGYRESQAKRAVASLRVGADTSLEAALRMTLQALASDRPSPGARP
jgi:hypothetical protein